MRSFRAVRQCYLLALVAALGCGGSAKEGSRVGGETNWLLRCDRDSACGVGQCVCGRCTIECSGGADSCDEGPPGSSCVSGGELPLSCPVAASAGVCLPPPSAPASPALGSSLLDETLELLAADLEALPAEDRGFIRYLSVANLREGELDRSESGSEVLPEEAGQSASDLAPEAKARWLAFGRAAANELANSLSQSAVAHEPESVDRAGLFQRIDLRDYGWNQALTADGVRYSDGWEAIVAHASLAVEYQGPAADHLRALSGARVPWLFADDFVAAASVGETYYALLGLPDNLDDLRFRLVRQRALNQDPAYRAAFENSGVSQLTRVVERSAIGRGLWQAFDFQSEERGVAVYSDPMGFEPDSTELMFTLPNGLYGFFVADAGGQRLRGSPLVPSELDGVNAASCFSCHNGGLIPFTDELRERWASSPSATPGEALVAVLDAYPDRRIMDLLMSDDNADYLDALRRAGIEPGGPDPVSARFRDFQADLSSRRLAGELLVTPQRLSERSSLLPAAFEAAELSREAFLTNYLPALCVLHEGSQNLPLGCE